MESPTSARPVSGQAHRLARPLGRRGARSHLSRRAGRTAAPKPSGEGGGGPSPTREAHARVRGLAQALLDRELSPDRPILILSGNGIDHGLLALAAMYVGRARTRRSRPHIRCRRESSRRSARSSTACARDWCSRTSGAPFERALTAVLPADAELVVSTAPPDVLPATSFEALAGHARRRRRGRRARRCRAGHHRQGALHLGIDRTAEGRHQHAAHALLQPGDDALGARCSSPTRRRCCATGCRGTTPPAAITTSASSSTTAARSTSTRASRRRALFGATVRNLREVPCTGALHRAALLRDADAAPAQRRGAARDVLPRPEAAVLRGGRPRPAVLGRAARPVDRGVRRGDPDHDRLRRDGDRAVRALHRARPGPSPAWSACRRRVCEFKLAPVGSQDRGARARPEHHAGLLARRGADARRPSTRRASTGCGDAMRFVDPDDPTTGLVFDGRLAEDFKLSTGTWVSVGPLRARILAAAAGCAQDVVITRPRSRLRAGALVFPNLAMCRELAGLADDTPARDVVAASAGACRDSRTSLAGLAAREHRQLDVRRARHAARRAAVARRARDHRQGIAEPEGGAPAPLGAGRRALRDTGLTACHFLTRSSTA